MNRQLDTAHIAAILDELGHEIEALGASLCADPVFCADHIQTLQAIDLIAQKQHGLAEVLRAGCHIATVDKIGVEALQARIRLKHYDQVPAQPEATIR